MEYEFLELIYPGTGFLVNRKQFFSSSSLEELSQLEKPMAYLDQMMRYGEYRLPLIDFSRFWEEIFPYQWTEYSALCLIIKLEKLGLENRRLISALYQDNPGEKPSPFLAVKVCSQAEIQHINVKQIKALPGPLRAIYQPKGFLACRFSHFREEDKLEFLLDLDRLIYYMLNTRKKE